MKIGATEFTVGGVQYQSEPMSVFDQFAVASRLSGVLAMLMIASKDADQNNRDGFVRGFCSLSGDIRKADSDYVIRACLSGCKRQAGEAWAPLMNTQGGLMYDLDMVETLTIIWEVLRQHRIPDFFAAPAPTTGGETTGKA